jgi:hypothetical protein
VVGACAETQSEHPLARPLPMLPRTFGEKTLLLREMEFVWKTFVLYLAGVSSVWFPSLAGAETASESGIKSGQRRLLVWTWTTRTTQSLSRRIVQVTRK